MQYYVDTTNIISSWWQFFYSQLAKKPLLTSFVIILISSSVFGLWFKIKQLSILSYRLIHYYPLGWYAFSIMQFLLIFCVLWLVLVSLSLLIERKKGAIKNNLLFFSLPFIAFWLSIFDIKLLYQVSLFGGFSLLLILLKILQNKAFHKIREPLVVLMIFTATYLIIFTSLSPLYHTSFFDTYGRIDFFLNFEHQWENAKAYDFIGNFTQQGKLGGNSQGIYMVSELSSFIVLLFDIPLVDLLGKYASIKFMFFGLYIFGSYGCYLFLRNGLKLSFLPSLIGGLGFIFGNAPFLSFYNTEYPIHQVPFIFFPWVLFFLARAYSLNKPALVMVGIGIAGLVASLSEYTLSSHPEINFLYFSFCNLYNVYLAFCLFAKNRFKLKPTYIFFINILIFPISHMAGLFYKFLPLIKSLIDREYALYDSASYIGGLPWDYSSIHWSTFFFRIGDSVIKTNLTSPIASPPIFFFTGQFVMLLIYAFIIIFCTEVLKRILKKGGDYSQNVSIENSFFFLVMVIFLVINMSIGNHSWLSELMKLTGLLRIHAFIRLNMFYFLFALMAAMFGLHYILNLKNKLVLNIIFVVYILNLILMYFFPVVPKVSKLIYVDVFILFLLYTLFYFSIRSCKIPRRRSLIEAMLIFIALLSFFTINPLITKIVVQKNNNFIKSADNIYISFRSAVTLLRNNQHDKASFKYLDKRLNNFIRDIKPKIVEDDILYSNKIISEDTYNGTLKYYFKISDIIQKNNTSQLQLYEAIAPEIDNFYINYGPMYVQIGASPPYWGPLVVDINNMVQFYLPDAYKLIAYTSATNETSFLPLGKNSEISAGLFYSSPAYPAIDINFHLNSLYPDLIATKKPESGFYLWPIELKHLIHQDFSDTPGRPKMEEVRNLAAVVFENKANIKKLLNIYGVDYILFLKYYLKECEKDYRGPMPFLDLDQLKDKGFAPLTLPDSYRLAPRFHEHYEVAGLQNLQSYGRAYVAEWVKVIKPSENLMNDKKYNYFNIWPLSEDLINNFNSHISEIPANIWRAALIESSNPKDYSDSPYVYSENNTVNTIKIIGSKAVFDVDCQEDNCWFIYNTAVLKGWKAFSSSHQLPIHKANLGFIGVNLNKGKHFLWMEYRPFSTILGFIVTFSGWIIVFSFFILKLPAISQE